MVKWTDKERAVIVDIFAAMDYEDIGPKALSRCLIVYPWTQRYFGSFGNLSNAAAIIGNPKIAAHGVKVLHGMDLALKHMDNIMDAYTDLSILHSDTLHVDPDNFRLLADCLTIVVAAKMGHSFTPDMQHAFQKFLSAVVSALGKHYC